MGQDAVQDPRRRFGVAEKVTKTCQQRVLGCAMALLPSSVPSGAPAEGGSCTLLSWEGTGWTTDLIMGCASKSACLLLPLHPSAQSRH